MNNSKPVVSIRNLTFAYDGEPVLEAINLDVHQGDFVGILGPNGGGKTTLLKIILGELEPLSGSILVFDRKPAQSAVEIGYVPQFLQFDKDFPISVRDVVLMGRLHQNALLPYYTRDDHRRAMEAMEQVSVPDLAHRRFGSLSGGQKQRALIARALMTRPGLLLLDEPTASVDIHVEKDIYDLLHKLNDTIPIMLVTHDLSFVSAYVNRIGCLNRRLTVHEASEVSESGVGNLYHSNVQMIQHHCEL